MRILVLAVLASVLSSCSSQPVMQNDVTVKETMASLEQKYERLSSREAVWEFQEYLLQFEGKEGFESLAELEQKAVKADDDANQKLLIEQLALEFTDYESCMGYTTELRALQTGHPWTHQGMDQSSQATVQSVIGRCVELGVAYINARAQSSMWVSQNLDKNIEYIEIYDPALGESIRQEVCSKWPEINQIICLSSE